MKKILLTIICLIIFIPFCVFGQVQTFDRNNFDNYGVNKKWEITDNNLNNVLNTKMVDASEKIYDFSGALKYLDQQQLPEIKEAINQYIELTGMDLIILIDDLPYSSDIENENYAVNFYDYNDFGLDLENYSGTILFRNTYSEDPYYNIYMFGNTQLYYAGPVVENILDDIYSNIHNGWYAFAIKKYISLLTDYYNNGIPDYLRGYYVDDMGYLQNDRFDNNIQTYKRDDFDNFGVNKNISISETDVKKTLKVDASQKIYDFAEILLPEEELKLKQSIDKYISKTNMDFAVVTYYLPTTSEDENLNFIENFYKYNDFGLDFENYSGSILFRNVYNIEPYYTLYSYGNAQLYYNNTGKKNYDNRQYKIIESTYYQYIETGKYLNGFYDVISMMSSYYDDGICEEMKNYTVNPDGTLKNHFVIPWKAAFYPSLIVSLIINIILRKKHKSIIKATNAEYYLKTETIKFTLREDNLISTHTTKRYNPPQSSSSGSSGGYSGGHSGGGFSSSRGSSGGGHSSGSGRHG